MTPLVDLAFLLLTFFLLHAGMARPRVMQLTMPVRDERDASLVTELREHGVMTILLGRHHRLHYYYGLNNPLDMPLPKVETTEFGAQGIRRVLLTREEPIDYLILIKPTPEATYKDVVDILDEMNITGQKRHALVNPSAADAELLCRAGY